MAKIAPSILSADFVNLERDIHNIEENGGDWVHVDVMDGIFVPNITIGLPVLRDIRRVTKLPLDVHLMIDRPIRYASQFIKANPNLELAVIGPGNATAYKADEYVERQAYLDMVGLYEAIAKQYLQ